MSKVAAVISLAVGIAIGGCASNESIVTSKKSEPGTIEKGIVYSLPKQLVKVSYTRSAIDSAKAAKKKAAAEAEVETTEKSIAKKNAKEKELSALIKAIDPQDPGRLEAEAQYNLQLTKVKAEKLLLTQALVTQKKKLATATAEYAISLDSDEAFSEQLTFEAEPPIADIRHTFYAQIQHQGMYSDSLELKTKNGLLDGAVGFSEDKKGEIIVSLAGGFSGLVQGLSLQESSRGTFNLPPVFDKKGCEKKGAVSVSQSVDPDNSEDLKVLNAQLKKGCIGIDVKWPEITQASTIDGTPTADGLVYRQPGAVTFVVNDLSNDTEIRSVRLVLAQGGRVGIISMPKGGFSKNEYDVAFTNGMLTKSKVVQPSETLGAVMVLPNTLRAIFAIPTELIQLKVNYSSSEKELIELKKTMLEAQIEIEKKQLELEALSASTSKN